MGRLLMQTLLSQSVLRMILAVRLDFNLFLVTVAGRVAKGGWTNSGSLVVPWKQWSIRLAKNNTQLMIYRRDQKKK